MLLEAIIALSGLRQPSDPTTRAVVYLAWFFFHQSIQVEALVELEQYTRTRGCVLFVADRSARINQSRGS